MIPTSIDANDGMSDFILTYAAIFYNPDTLLFHNVRYASSFHIPVSCCYIIWDLV